MSVLDTPRVYFRGQMTWDPMVTNNFDALYDLDTGKPVLGTGTADDYREQARQTIVQGNWNVHGTHRSTFFETTVTGIDRGAGREVDDPLIGVPVSFTGMLVDLDPYGATSSQLFFDQLSCGIDGGCQIRAVRNGPMVARRINFARNSGYRVIAGVASVVWQASFAAGDLLAIRPHGSPVLEELARLVEEGDAQGVTVRFNAYRTAYYGTEAPTDQQAADLAAQIAAGGFHPNPARSVIVGVLGLWRKGEPPAVPADRVLARAARSPVSTAFAKVGGGRLSIDLANSVPETGFDLQKTDLGTLSVVSRTAGGDLVLGTLPFDSYDKAAYDATSGLVDLALDEAGIKAARNGNLEVRGPDGTVLLREQPLTVCADQANVYLEEGEGTAVRLRAFERGERPSAPVSVLLAEVGGPSLPPSVETDADGLVTVPLTGNTAGSTTWILVPWRGQAPPPPTRLVPDQNEYFTLRVTPADAAIAAMDPTWENVYQNVLRDWDALAPAMDNWLRLDDEQQCRAYAPLIKQLTSRARFDDFRYMPVTRDLSRGQRTLLHRWCDAVMAGAAPEAGLAGAAPETGRDPFGRGF